MLLTYNVLTEVGCKRVIVDTGYYECLHQPNMKLNNDPIIEINETGILTKIGTHVSQQQVSR